MKTLVYVLVGILCFSAMALGGIVIYTLYQVQKEKNKSRTANANKMRWPQNHQKEEVSQEENKSEDEKTV